jgi:phosphohistidine phosphatase SixA
MAAVAPPRPGSLVVMLVVRHGRAGKRGQAGGDDSGRRLDGRGRRQALALSELLAGYPVDRILSSPYARCLETVGPLASRLDLELEPRGELAEGASAAAVRGLIAELGRSGAVLCTHGDVIAELIGPGRKAGKGSVWVLDGDDLRPVEYLET